MSIVILFVKPVEWYLSTFNISRWFPPTVPGDIYHSRPPSLLPTQSHTGILQCLNQHASGSQNPACICLGQSPPLHTADLITRGSWHQNLDSWHTPTTHAEWLCMHVQLDSRRLPLWLIRRREEDSNAIYVPPPPLLLASMYVDFGF